MIYIIFKSMIPEGINYVDDETTIVWKAFPPLARHYSSAQTVSRAPGDCSSRHSKNKLRSIASKAAQFSPTRSIAFRLWSHSSRSTAESRPSEGAAPLPLLLPALRITARSRASISAAERMFEAQSGSAAVASLRIERVKSWPRREIATVAQRGSAGSKQRVASLYGWGTRAELNRYLNPFEQSGVSAIYRGTKKIVKTYI